MKTEKLKKTSLSDSLSKSNRLSMNQKRLSRFSKRAYRRTGIRARFRGKESSSSSVSS